MRLLTVFLLSAMMCSPSLAHHSRANFDSNSTVSITGTVTDFAWRNPHIFIEVEAVGDSGQIENWLVEAGSVTSMRRRGWVGDSLTAGDEITFVGSPDFDASKRFVNLDYIEKADGTLLATSRRPTAAPPRIEPSADFSGTWGMDLSKFDLRAAGGGPPADWSYTAAGEEMVDNFHIDQNPELDCKEIGVPRIIIYPYMINFVRDETSLRVHKEHLNERRVIWLDEDAVELESQQPSYVGTSVGRFDGDRHLIVESDNFLPTQWGTANGVNSSAEKKVTEEYVLAEDGLSFELRVTVEDPVYLAEPVVQVVSFNKSEDREFTEPPCDPTAASRHMTLE